MKKTNKLTMVLSLSAFISYSAYGALQSAPAQQGGGFWSKLFSGAQQTPAQQQGGGFLASLMDGVKSAPTGRDSAAYTQFINQLQAMQKEAMANAEKMQKELLALSPAEKAKALKEMQKLSMEQMQTMFGKFEQQYPEAAKAVKAGAQQLSEKFKQGLQNLLQSQTHGQAAQQPGMLQQLGKFGKALFGN